MWIDIIGIDIETDTTPAPDGAARGLDPATTSIVNIAIATSTGCRVLRADGTDASEKAMLSELDQILRQAPQSVIATWNGSVFDFPFIADRAARHGLRIGARMEHDPDIVPKYAPTPGHAGGYRVEWDTDAGPAHTHIDVAYRYRDLAAHAGVPWSLKPVAKHLGLDPVEVDRTAIHELSPAAQDEYVASDATVTRALAWLLLHPADV